MFTNVNVWFGNNTVTLVVVARLIQIKKSNQIISNLAGEKEADQFPIDLFISPLPSLNLSSILFVL